MCNDDDNADIGDDNSSGDGQEDYGDVLMMMMDQGSRCNGLPKRLTPAAGSASLAAVVTQT